MSPDERLRSDAEDILELHHGAEARRFGPFVTERIPPHNWLLLSREDQERLIHQQLRAFALEAEWFDMELPLEAERVLLALRSRASEEHPEHRKQGMLDLGIDLPAPEPRSPEPEVPLPEDRREDPPDSLSLF